MNRIKQWLHLTISQGLGKQLLWLCILSISVVSMLFLCAHLFFKNLVWQDVVALFLDPGCFSGAGRHDIFRLLTALLGCFIFSALLVSVFSNIIDNISENWHNGNVRYKHSNHILILGAHSHLLNILQALKDDWNGDVVIMTSSDVRGLRDRIEKLALPKKFLKSVFLYSGERDNPTALQSLSLEKCHSIYILGEDEETNSDAVSISCSSLLQQFCSGASKRIHLYVMLHQRNTMEIFARNTRRSSTDESISSALDIEYINRDEYIAEELLAGTSFMPFVTEDEPRALQFVVFGSTPMAESMTCSLALVSHFPNYLNVRKRTYIDVIAQDADILMHRMIAANENLFRLSNWSLYNESGIAETHSPSVEDGDYLDVEWRFFAMDAVSPAAHRYYNDMAADKSRIKRIIICEKSDDVTLNRYLYLPDIIKKVPVAVYQSRVSPLFEMAARMPFYNQVTVFSPADASFDALFVKRTARGMKVNFAYDKAYNTTPSATEQESWRKLSESHKFSSIYSGSAFCVNHISELFRRGVNEHTISEMEHRRWNMTALFLGYRPMRLAESAAARSDSARFKELKAQFIHPDIAPYDALPEEEKLKDLTVMRGMAEERHTLS